MGGKWVLRDWKSPERTVVGTLTKLYNASDGDTNVQIRANDASQHLLRNRHGGRNTDLGIIECEINVVGDGRDQYEDWVRSMLGLEVTAKGVWVDDDDHNSKTELHPMDLIVASIDGSLIPDWIGEFGRRRGLVLGTSMLAFRFAAASDDREGLLASGPPLVEWDRPTSISLAVPPRPAGGFGWFEAAELKIFKSLNAVTDTSPRPQLIDLEITCNGRDYGGPGYSLGEVVTYWASPAQVGFVPDKLSFGLLGIGEVAVRTLRIWNPGIQTIVVTVLPAQGGLRDFSWQAPPVTTLLPGAGLDVPVQFSPLSHGVANDVLIVESNAQGSPHRISLRGRGRPGTPQ
jgi:hypothetical protein